MSKKKLSIYLFVLLVTLFSCAYATPSNANDLQEEVLQNTIILENEQNQTKNNVIKGFFNSSVWEQYKDEMPFSTNSTIMFRLWRTSNKYCINIYFMGGDSFELSMNINNNGFILPNQQIHFNSIYSFWADNNTYSLRFANNTENDWQTNLEIFNINYNISTDVGFTMAFTNNPITNNSNYTLYGSTYTCGVWVPNITANVNKDTELYRIGERLYRQQF